MCITTTDILSVDAPENRFPAADAAAEAFDALTTGD